MASCATRRTFWGADVFVGGFEGGEEGRETVEGWKGGVGEMEEGG